MRVLAIDPGTIKMGYGFLTGDPAPEVVDHGVVELSRYTDIGERLFQMFTHVRNMISIFQPDAVAVEEPFVGRGDRQFIKPAIAVGQAQAVVLIGAASAGIPVHRYSPAEVKRAVADYGAASKDQMQRALAVYPAAGHPARIRRRRRPVRGPMPLNPERGPVGPGPGNHPRVGTLGRVEP